MSEENGVSELIDDGCVSIKSLAMVHTRVVIGVSAFPVVVEVHLANGLPAFSTVGLPETTVKESKDRVRGAILNSGFEFPAKRITVNLAPADLPKSGGRFDLPIAIGILLASGQLTSNSINQYELIGELALNGDLRAVTGVLPSAIQCNKTGRQLILPEANAVEAGLANSGQNLQADGLLSVCRHLSNLEALAVCNSLHQNIDTDEIYPDMSDVRGQQYAKRVIEIAASGGHSLLFIGPPGTGKSMLSSRLPGILPDLSLDEALDVAAIGSVSHGEFDAALWLKRPFRAPHHSASSVALVGGGSLPKPGEITLAHHGVLFLDEFIEFSRSSLEQLREPLETGFINIARANLSVQYPAEFMLIAACNPCRCGFYADGSGRCQCSVTSVEAYRSKLSGPMLDRIDMHVHLSRVSVRDLQAKRVLAESSKSIKERVICVRELQKHRQNKLNSQYSNSDIETFCDLSDELLLFLECACEKLNMSARAYHRVLKLARTIADMEQAKQINQVHLAEALGLRSLDRRV